jgi:hypothetical protein
MDQSSAHNDCDNNVLRETADDEQKTLMYNISQSMRRHKVNPLIDTSLSIQNGWAWRGNQDNKSNEHNSSLVNFRYTYAETLQKESLVNLCNCQVCPVCNAFQLVKKMKKEGLRKKKQRKMGKQTV